MITDLNFWLTVFISVPVYWLVPNSRRSMLLTAISFAYLMSLDPKSVFYLLCFTILYYYVAPRHRDSTVARQTTAALLCLSLAYLALFKFLPAAISRFSDQAPLLASIVLPLGISYYTFKLVHYAVERGRGNLPEHSLWDFAAYLYLFPIFTAGPIERFEHFMNNRSRRLHGIQFSEGVIRIVHGLVKKLVIIELCLLPLFGEVTDVAILIDRLEDLPTYKVWGFFVLAFLVAYLDFSAYSDIAIGISRLFGITIAENFNWPVLATNIGSFWRRWHMSLSGWCQTYVYMPTIGLTRNPYFASYCAFLVMGLWHSGSLGWIMWGLWHASGTSAYAYWTRLRRRRKWRGLDRPYWRFVGIPATMAFVCCGGVFTMALETAGAAATMNVFAKMLGID